MLLDLILIIGFFIVIAVILIAHHKKVAVSAEIKAILARVETYLKNKP